MKTYKTLITELKSRTLTKYIKSAEPQAKNLGFLGVRLNDQGMIDKADKRLKNVLKTKNKLDLMQPVHEQTCSRESCLQNLDHHIENTIPDNENKAKLKDLLNHLEIDHKMTKKELKHKLKNNMLCPDDYKC